MKAKDVRKGTVILHNKAPHRIMDFHHHTPGNLRAMVHLKLRNLASGTQTEVRLSSTEDVEVADMNSFKASFLYSDADGAHFMNTESFDQVALSDDILGDGKFFLQEGMEVHIETYNGDPIAVQFPATVVLTVVETEPEVRGATASNSPKPAKTDTGLTLAVPPFVKVGDKIEVNTSESKYLGRV